MSEDARVDESAVGVACPIVFGSGESCKDILRWKSIIWLKAGCVDLIRTHSGWL